MALIAALDVPGEELRLWTLPARHLSAVDLAQTLSELAGLPASLGAGAGAASRRRRAPRPPPAPRGAAPAGAVNGVARLQPDDRAGRLLVVATDAAFARLAALAARLDVPAETRAAKVHAYRCRHADCDAVSAILATLADIQVARGPNPDGRAQPRRRARPAPPPASARRRPPAAPRRARRPLFGGEVRVTSDPSTNALLVLSSLDDFRTLRRLIEEIDVPRKQVFIEATIMEVLRSKDRQVGVSYHGGRPAGGGAVAGGFNAARTLLLDESTLGSALVGLSGLAVGAPLQGVASRPRPAGRQRPLARRLHPAAAEERQRRPDRQPAPADHQQPRGRDLGGPAGARSPAPSPSRSTAPPSVAFSPRSRSTGRTWPSPSSSPPTSTRTASSAWRSTRRCPSSGPTSAASAPRPPAAPPTRPSSPATSRPSSSAASPASGRPTPRRRSPCWATSPCIGFLFRSTQKITEKQNIILALTPYVIDEPADLTRVLEAKLRDRREFARLFGSDEERRLLLGPLEPAQPGMLERIHRAVKRR